MSRYDRYDERALKALETLGRIARARGAEAASVEDLAGALAAVTEREFSDYLGSEGLAVNPEFAAAMRGLAERGVSSGPALKLDPSLRALFDAVEAARPEGKIGIADLASLLRERHEEDFKRAAIPAAEARAKCAVQEAAAPAEPQSERPARAASEKAGTETDPGEAFVEGLGGVDLVKTCKDVVVIGRDREMDALVSVLIRYFKPNAMLVGDPGVGKTAIVEGLARRIAEGAVPERLKGSRIISLRVGDLLAGTSLAGAIEERMKALVKWLEITPGAILFLDEVHQLGQSKMTEPIAEAIKPALARGSIRCIAATTTADYHRSLDSDGALTRRFQSIRVPEPDAASTLEILRGLEPRLRSHYGISASPEVLGRAVAIAEEYITGRRFPDKAIDVLDRAYSTAYLGGAKEVGETHLAKAVEDASGARPGLGDPFQGLETRLGAAVLGQDEAIAASVRVIRLCKRKLDLRPQRPDGVLLFLGPSGVGKTELAKVIARELSGRADGLSRLDMSEYREEFSQSRLLGAPAGYVGYDDEPVLSAIVERNPTGILLLDEFEKAHPAIQRLFLQIFDEGVATDHHGKELRFSRMTIIATTNAGGDARATVGFLGDAAAPARGDGIPESVMASLRERFPAELLNRFDEIVPFRPLGRPECARIVREILAREAIARASAAGTAFSVTEACVEAVVAAGYRPEFGARGLSRAFQELVLEPLSEALAPGAGSLVADAEGGRVTIRQA